MIALSHFKYIFKKFPGEIFANDVLLYRDYRQPQILTPLRGRRAKTFGCFMAFCTGTDDQSVFCIFHY